MVDNVEQVNEEAPAKPKSKGLIKLVGVVVGVMLIEAVVIFVLVKSYVTPPPQAAQASGAQGLEAGAGQKAPAVVEVEIVKFRAQNEKSQRIMSYDLSIFAVVSSEKEAEFKQLIEQRRETVKDRFTRIVRSTDPARFQEADLATLREQFKHELSQIVGEGEIVREVLIPSITSSSEN